jgi:starch synthase
MRILIASSEILPYSKTGGLADMVGALAKFLARAGHAVGVVTPLYRGLREKWPEMRLLDWKLDLPLGEGRVSGKIWTLEPTPGLTIYFVEHKELFERGELYQERGFDYRDNAERFIFFSKCVAHLARYLPWRPEVLHLHDWQSALAALFVLDQKLRDGWIAPPTVCVTVHNLAYQGTFEAAKFALTNLPESYFQPEGVEFYGFLNCLKAGLSYADLITTVSPRYAREITTESLGCGLDGVLRRRPSVLHGILNGVDYEEWKTEGNPFLKCSYNMDELGGKAVNKAFVQREFGLPPMPDTPLFGTVTRLAEQKGVVLQLSALQEMLAGNMQFVLLGSGQREYERAYRRLTERYPDKCAVQIGFDTGLSHRLEAGCDFYLMPSRFEPCGLNQMYSLRYGTTPIVRLTGGLDDSVTDITEDEELADGIKFAEYSVRALSKAVRKAHALYADKPLLRHYQSNGMARDFSWERTAAAYAALYQGARTL